MLPRGRTMTAMKPGLTLLSLLWMRKEPVSDPVDPEVLDRAVEEGRESVRTGMHVNTAQAYQEQEFRAIAAAAYRQGREDGLREARERIEYTCSRPPSSSPRYGRRGRSEPSR